MKTVKRVLLAVVVGISVMGCQKDEIFDVENQFAIDNQLMDEYLNEHNIVAQTHESGLRYTIENEGAGENAKFGSTVVVKYEGNLLDGTEFDSTDAGETFSFVIGRGEVVQGWEIGFTLLNEGATATLYVPSKLGYGNNAVGTIPANSVLIFHVQVVRIP